MPSSKPRLMTYTDKDIIEKFDIISKKENRSMSKQLEFIVKEYINNYEKKNGRVSIDVHHNETVNINN